VIEEAWLQSADKNKEKEESKNKEKDSKDKKIKEKQENKQDSIITDNKNPNQKSDALYVEVQNGENIFEKRYLTLGLSDGIHIEVLKGLKVGDKIKKPN